LLRSAIAPKINVRSRAISKSDVPSSAFFIFCYGNFENDHFQSFWYPLHIFFNTINKGYIFSGSVPNNVNAGQERLKMVIFEVTITENKKGDQKLLKY